MSAWRCASIVCAAGRDVGRRIAGIELGQCVEHGAAVHAERREQLVADLERGDVGRARGLGARELAALDDRAPVVAARIECMHVDVDADVDRESAQEIEIQRRQRRHREHLDAPRQTHGKLRVLRQRLEEALARIGAHGIGQRARDFAPKRRLPRLVVAKIAQAAARPRGDPLRAIDQIAIERVGDRGGEFEAPQRFAAFEVARHRGERGIAPRLGQAFGQPPAQRLGLQRRGGGDIREHAADQPPDERRGELRAHVGRDAERCGKLESQPAPHRGRRHHDDLGRERRQRRIAHDLRDARGERFETIGGMEAEHRRRRC